MFVFTIYILITLHLRLADLYLFTYCIKGNKSHLPPELHIPHLKSKRLELPNVLVPIYLYLQFMRIILKLVKQVLMSLSFNTVKQSSEATKIKV